MSIKEISKEVIKAVVGANGRQKVTRLDFSQNEIRRIENLNELKHLESIDLSHNKIESSSGLQECKSLTRINLSHNELKSLEGLRQISGLLSIDLRFNRLTDVKTLHELSSNSSLKEIFLQGNDSITCAPNYRDSVRDILPQIEKIDGLNVSALARAYAPSVDVSNRFDRETVEKIISDLERQIAQKDVDVLQFWRKKCQEMLTREKIMNYRLNEQAKVLEKAVKEKEFAISQSDDSDRRNAAKLASLNEKLVEQERVVAQQMRVISKAFESQMDELFQNFDTAIRQQEKRFFTLEGALIKQKNSMNAKCKKVEGNFLEFKSTIQTIIRTYGESEMLSDVSSENFIYEVQKYLRNTLIELKDAQARGSKSSKAEVNALQEEIIHLQASKKSIMNQMIEKEEDIAKLVKQNESRVKELMGENEALTKRVREINSASYELEQRIEVEKSEKSSWKKKSEEAEDSIHRMRLKIEEFEREIARQNALTREKDLELQAAIESERKKSNEINTLENQIVIEIEKRNRFSNQANDLVKILEAKELKIKQLKELSRSNRPPINFPNPSSSQYQSFYQQNHNNLFAHTHDNNNRIDPSNGLGARNSGSQGNRTVVHVPEALHMMINQNSYAQANRLNQTDIMVQNGRMQRQQRQSDDWSPIPKVNPRIVENNFGSNRAATNMILNDLSVINNQQGLGGGQQLITEHQMGVLTLEEELRFKENEGKVYQILDDSL